MSKHILFILLSSLAGSITSQAQVILPVKKRSDVVAKAEVVISNVDRVPGQYETVKSPFVLIEKEVPETIEQVGSSTEEVSEVAPAILSDKVALQAVSQQFKPIGSLILGKRGMLQLGSGRTIEKGATFSAEINGTNYNVLIEDVTNSGYTLRLGEAVIQKTFLKTDR